MTKPNSRHVTEWNNETYLINPCVYNSETHTFEVLLSYPDIAGNGTLTGEVIELGEGNNLDVCMTCHKGILNVLEGFLCSNQSCEVNSYFEEE